MISIKPIPPLKKKKLIIKRTYNPIFKKWSKDINRDLSIEKSDIAFHHLLLVSASGKDKVKDLSLVRI